MWEIDEDWIPSWIPCRFAYRRESWHFCIDYPSPCTLIHPNAGGTWAQMIAFASWANQLQGKVGNSPKFQGRFNCSQWPGATEHDGWETEWTPETENFSCQWTPDCIHKKGHTVPFSSKGGSTMMYIMPQKVIGGQDGWLGSQRVSLWYWRLTFASCLLLTINSEDWSSSSLTMVSLFPNHQLRSFTCLNLHKPYLWGSPTRKY